MRNKEDVKKQFQEDLSIIKFFVSRKAFKKLCFLCSVRSNIDFKKQNWGKMQLGVKPDISDFFRAMKNLSASLFPATVENVHKKEVCDPATVLACLEILFRNQDYKCIEKICQLIDENDCDEEAVRIRKILLTTRNNLTTAKVNRG